MSGVGLGGQAVILAEITLRFSLQFDIGMGHYVVAIVWYILAILNHSPQVQGNRFLDILLSFFEGVSGGKTSGQGWNHSPVSLIIWCLGDQ